ncbi:MAG: Crp/Fnr family transcriptional regulator [Melioribacteraceae bacterium]|nr:Crp/Fnr family transcriptional regulator [Melioribacteraceae bacterium]
MEIRQLISKSNFFKGFSVKNSELIYEIGTLKKIKKKEQLFCEGDKGYSFFLCVEGKVQLSKTTADGKEIVIRVITSGELFGEVILFENNVYPVTATTLSETEIFIIKKENFYGLLDQKEFRNEFFGLLIRKQRYLAERIKYLTIHDVEDRLFKFLEEHYSHETEFKLELSKKDLAAAIGTTPETLSRLILRLTNENKIMVDGNKWKII